MFLHDQILGIVLLNSFTLSMVKNLSVAVLDLCSLKHVKELPWKGFIPDQGLSGISIDLDTVRLHMYLFTLAQ